ncbi:MULTISPECIES: hypothetical protein [Acinetobacter]|uniref:hypothetical protein n=1 Tax=Acinetobacter TaxID=469 RepID=UPI001F60D49E|nr:MULTISPECIES: hypothetical protein [Acinetobacter]MCI3877731.1 hypothetical protein [Acinetobacter higginsii]MCJ0830479.1 hypothetical protein [Acinetobacter sp. NIPH1876]
MTTISNQETADKFNQDLCFLIATQAKKITIPAVADHEGYRSMTVTLPWVCMHCGGPRGEIKPGMSYDGGLKMQVDMWDNPCGHLESYADVRVFVAKYRDQLKHLEQAIDSQKEVS